MATHTWDAIKYACSKRLSMGVWPIKNTLVKVTWLLLSGLYSGVVKRSGWNLYCVDRVRGKINTCVWQRTGGGNVKEGWGDTDIEGIGWGVWLTAVFEEEGCTVCFETYRICYSVIVKGWRCWYWGHWVRGEINGCVCKKRGVYCVFLNLQNI